MILNFPTTSFPLRAWSKATKWHEYSFSFGKQKTQPKMTPQKRRKNTYPPRSLTARPWKMMVGRWVSFWVSAYFRGYVKLQLGYFFPQLSKVGWTGQMSWAIFFIAKNTRPGPPKNGGLVRGPGPPKIPGKIGLRNYTKLPRNVPPLKSGLDRDFQTESNV